VFKRHQESLYAAREAGPEMMNVREPYYALLGGDHHRGLLSTQGLGGVLENRQKNGGMLTKWCSHKVSSGGQKQNIRTKGQDWAAHLSDSKRSTRKRRVCQQKAEGGFQKAYKNTCNQRVSLYKRG